MEDANDRRTEREQWPLVSVLFITYKRIDLLESAISAIRRNTDYPNLELVISDDGSPKDIQEQMKTLPADVYVLATKNRGLGANINQGMAACRGKYVLMVQDDWRCEGPADYLLNSVRLMEAHPIIGIVSYVLKLKIADRLDKLDGVDERAVLGPLDPADRDYPFLYSDQPHLRRSSINELMGPYLEDRDVRKCEQDYERRWDAQTAYRTAMFPAYSSKLFSNQGIEVSFRELRFRNKVDRALLPLAERLRSYPIVFRTSKRAVRTVQVLLERLRITRV